MKQVRTSSLSKIKTVFDSTDSNVFHFKTLNKSFNQNEFGVELAQPIVRYSNNVVQWKAKASSELLPFNVLSKEEQDSVAQIIQQTFTDFRERTSIKPESFYDNIMEIPGSDSLLVGKSSDGYEIVITDWGFLEDTIDRETGVLYQLFPVPDFSVLARLKNQYGKVIPNEKIILKSGDISREDLTDNNGCARLGDLMRDTDFTLKSNSGSFLPKDFSADGRDFYDVILQENIKLSFRVRNEEGIAIPNCLLEYHSTQSNTIHLKTNSLGIAEVTQIACDDQFSVRKDKLILKEKIPNEDTLYDIVISEEKVLPIDEETEISSGVEEPVIKSPVTLIFLNRFGKAISNLNVEVRKREGDKFLAKETNSEGKIEIDNLQEGNYEVNFHRRSSQWNYSFDHEVGNKVHQFSVKPIYPWFWWLLCLLALILLIWCSFFNCFCQSVSTSNSPNSTVHQYEQRNLNNAPDDMLNENNLTKEINEEIIPCNLQKKSGGAGITMNNHELGNISGVVKIAFDMREIPDKLEVFYEGELVASTFDIPNHSDGFIGESIGSCCGLLSFKYEPKNDKYCTVKVTGNHNTEWSYGVGCPE